MNHVLAAIIAVVLAAPVSALAQLPEGSDTVGEPVDAKATAVLTVQATMFRDGVPNATVEDGYRVTWAANYIDGQPALLWCSEPDLRNCNGNTMRWPVAQTASGQAVRHALPNPAVNLAGRTVRMYLQLHKITATGGTLVARESRDLVFASSQPTPTPEPTPEPTPREPVWSIRSSVTQ